MTKGEQTGQREARDRVRVAVVGGGLAGLTTAFELTRPHHRVRYEVTVYQMGWRLGGKGASGRGVGGRIEEHGLHVWMGFYENAFRLMRECYAELARDGFRCPIATWQDAFKPAPFVAVTDRGPNGEWEPWVSRFPAGGGLPGDPLDENNPFSLQGYLSKSVSLVVELLRSAEAHRTQRTTADDPPDPAAAPSSWTSKSFGSLGSPEKLVEAADWVLRHGQLATAAALLEATQLLRASLDVLLPRRQQTGEGVLLRLVEAIAAAARRQLAAIVDGDASLRRTWQVIDLILAAVRGSIAHGLTLNPQGFDAIDDYDWREWLALHGASPESLNSGFIRGTYDLVFAYEDGDVTRPRLSAAIALRGAMRMFFTYRGSLFWQMSAGMGDVVFAPLYEVLKKRGVRFEFFHRLRDVHVSPEDASAPHVDALRFDVQAEVVGKAEYRPLVEIHGLPCWPAEPDHSQLIDGKRLRREGWQLESPWEPRLAGERVLRVGADFDFVVLAVGGGAVPGVCSQLIARSPKWQKMAANLHCVATQAFQIWMSEDMAALGWRHPPVSLSGWVEPFDTWADMSHLIPAERSQVPVRSIAYFCSPLSDPPHGQPTSGEEFHRAQKRRVRDSAVRFLNDEVGALWPKARDASGQFRWGLLAVESAEARRTSGEGRFDTQFWTANVRPSDRYAVSLPGAQRYRLSPLDMSFDNLTVAGDWTESGLNMGCVESAVMSGLLAAHALSGSPALEEIIGYDHP
jgi:uncharacterized protein with NAD-binding domain and iron-sulfur cluster